MTLEELEQRVKTLLPQTYQDRYEEIEPVSMGSAPLKYGADGKVAWDEIWQSFCDLAMAGGPPHKGKLLEPGTTAEILAQPEQYSKVVAEICRGIRLVAELSAQRAAADGWIRVECETSTKAQWLARAITMENISARYEEDGLELPAAASYRVEKEIKNVITSVAKTCHYWEDHMWSSQQKRIGELFARMMQESPFLQPARHGWVAVEDIECEREQVRRCIEARTALRASPHRYFSWIGFDCPDQRAAVWMMRALVAFNLLSRREGLTLFVPLDPVVDGEGVAVTSAVTAVYELARRRGVIAV
ncbi:MAG: hypothetical protein NZV14_00640 [Bryobacteraceae bacterium]|nr:hypothetical protein [Bryobacteraceae bacterium]MDW8376639.1 hypothetical protein [Bryobacterales bacterium]